MNLLRKYIRGLLSEAAYGIQDMSDNVYIAIEKFHPRAVRIYYSDADGAQYEARQFGHRVQNIVKLDEPEGKILIVDLQDREHGPCAGAWKVSSANAKKGWGPLLYDVAIEYASLNAGGLVADRDVVSPNARRVWDYYLSGRSDVTSHQLDNLQGKLTPEIEEDDCDQHVATFDVRRPTGQKYGAREKTFVDWVKSPLSKRYTKEPSTMTALRAAGRLIEQ